MRIRFSSAKNKIRVSRLEAFKASLTSLIMKGSFAALILLSVKINYAKVSNMLTIYA